MMALLNDRLPIVKIVNAKAINLEDAPKGYAEFDKGIAAKFVLDRIVGEGGLTTPHRALSQLGVCTLGITNQMVEPTKCRPDRTARATRPQLWRSTMSNRIAPKLLAEFIGTFAFVFIGAGAAAVIGDGVGLSGIGAIALAHGLAIMAFAFAFGPVSGAHFNPAVTVGVLAAGAMRATDAAGYIVAQLIGGIVGALLLEVVLGGAATGLGAPALAHGLMVGGTSLTITPAAGFVIEAALAFFLVTVVLGTAVAGRAGNLAPLAIGMTLTFNIIMGGPLRAPLSTRRVRSARWLRRTILAMPGCTWQPRSSAPSSPPSCIWAWAGLHRSEPRHSCPLPAWLNELIGVESTISATVRRDGHRARKRGQAIALILRALADGTGGPASSGLAFC
jgi:aquaporin Z